MVAVVAVVAADVSLDSEKIPGDGDGVSNLQPPLGAQLQLDVVDEDASIIRAGRIVHRQFIGGLVEANEGMLFAYVTLVAPTPQTQGFDFYVRAFACDAMRCDAAWRGMRVATTRKANVIGGLRGGIMDAEWEGGKWKGNRV